MLSRLSATGVTSAEAGVGSGWGGGRGSAAARGALAVTRLETRMLPALTKLELLMDLCVLWPFLMLRLTLSLLREWRNERRMLCMRVRAISFWTGERVEEFQ